jgi:hypothetical protein
VIGPGRVMSDKERGILLTVEGFLVLALGLAIIIWVVQPHVLPECRPDDIACDPTGHPPLDERFALRLPILGVATAVAIALAVAGRRLRERDPR